MSRLITMPPSSIADSPVPPLLANKHAAAPSVFAPSALLREARRQKGLANEKVPAVCILDPDGDIVRHLKTTGQAGRIESWPCYHTDLFECEHDGISTKELFAQRDRPKIFVG